MPGSWICIDASIVVRLVARPDDHVVLERWDAWLAEGRRLAAPTLLFYEVTNALHRYHRHGWMKEGTVRSALEAALALPVELHGDASLHERALEMATEFGLAAAYDAHYLALAERLRAEFWTADGKLVRAVGARFDWVRLLGS